MTLNVKMTFLILTLCYFDVFVHEANMPMPILSRNVNTIFRANTLILALHFLKMSTVVAETTSCIFCNIVNKVDNTEILYEDDDVAVFRDIKPASRFHVLTVPKRHIEDVKSLSPEDKELVAKMLTVAQEMLTKNNFSTSDARFGYHWPPFRSVKHLHLHAIAPESEMGLISKLVFYKDSYWFVSPDYVQSLL